MFNFITKIIPEILMMLITSLHSLWRQCVRFSSYISFWVLKFFGRIYLPTYGTFFPHLVGLLERGLSACQRLTADSGERSGNVPVRLQTAVTHKALGSLCCCTKRHTAVSTCSAAGSNDLTCTLTKLSNCIVWSDVSLTPGGLLHTPEQLTPTEVTCDWNE
jgi:hypothetical protein